MVDLRVFAVSQVVSQSIGLSMDQIIEETIKLVEFIRGEANLPEYYEPINPLDKFINEFLKVESSYTATNEKYKDNIS